MQRKIDDLGRIALPAEFRRRLNLQAGERMEVTLGESSITLTKQSNACIFCHSTYQLAWLKNRAVCESCRLLLADAEGGDLLYPDRR